MRRNLLIPLHLFLVLSGAAWPASADEIFLHNGDKISGTVVHKDNGFVTVKTSYAGEVKIDWQSVAAINAASPLTVLLHSGDIVQTSKIITPERLDIAGSAPAVNKVDVNLISPPPYISGKGALWSGRINIGATSSEGNTDNESINFNGETTARTMANRYRLAAQLNWTTEDSRETESNMEGTFKADHFLSKKWFAFGRTAAYKDRFQDLNLRAIVGTGSGYQFVESRLRNFSIELGLDYIVEDYRLADDEEYPALRWALNYNAYLYRERIQFFHGHGVNISLEDSEDILLESQTGLRFPITASFSSAVLVDFDWNNRPADGKDRRDTKYIFSLGYSW